VRIIWNYTVPFGRFNPASGDDRVILCHDTILPTVEYLEYDAVRFWTIHEQGTGRFDGEETHNWSFIVVGTGNDIPHGYEYVGTTLRNSDGNICHLFRKRV
jgi:hypothetical protein